MHALYYLFNVLWALFMFSLAGIHVPFVTLGVLHFAHIHNTQIIKRLKGDQIS